jgi:hypothetical protein
MHEEPTTAAIQRYLDALPADADAEPIIRDLLVWSVYLRKRIREVALNGESRGRSFGLVRLDLLLQIDPFASVRELVTS